MSSNNEHDIQTVPSSSTDVLRNSPGTDPSISQSGGNESHISQSQCTESPRTRRKRIRLIARHLSSSSLRRRRHKPVPCKYCPRFMTNREKLEQHLSQSEACFSLYLREYKVTTIEGTELHSEGNESTSKGTVSTS